MFPDVAEGSGDHDFHVGERCENLRSAWWLPGFSDGRMVPEWYHNRAGVEMQLRSWTRDPYLPEEKSEKLVQRCGIFSGPGCSPPERIRIRAPWGNSPAANHGYNKTNPAAGSRFVYNFSPLLAKFPDRCSRLLPERVEKKN